MATPDLFIAGAGPAGCAAAWTAARAGARVTLCEQSSFPRDKVCGEFISAEALPLLTEIVPDLVAASPVITHARFLSPSEHTSRFQLPAPARGISRWALDAALADAACAAGVRLHTRTRTDANAEGNHLVAIGRDFAPRPSRAVGIKAHLVGLEPSNDVEMYFFRGGYCGLAPVEKGWTNLCCLLDRRHAGDLRRSRDILDWVRVTLPSPALLRRVEPARQATPTVVTAHAALGPRAARSRSGALVCGDASGFLDPFTGDGLARGMLSGALAATCLLAGRPDDYPPALAGAAHRGFRLAACLRRTPNSLLPWIALPPLARALAAATRWRS